VGLVRWIVLKVAARACPHLCLATVDISTGITIHILAPHFFKRRRLLRLWCHFFKKRRLLRLWWLGQRLFSGMKGCTIIQGSYRLHTILLGPGRRFFTPHFSKRRRLLLMWWPHFFK
jgi:hypothetical protein